MIPCRGLQKTSGERNHVSDIVKGANNRINVKRKKKTHSTLDEGI